MREKPETWNDIVLNLEHPENGAAKRFLDIVTGPSYRALKDSNPRTRDWNLFLEGWRLSRFVEVPGKIGIDAVPISQCELSRTVCIEIQERLNRVLKENEGLKEDLSRALMGSSVKPCRCDECAGMFDLDDVITLNEDLLPATVDVSIGSHVMKVALHYPDIRNSPKRDVPFQDLTLCKVCFHRALGEVASYLVGKSLFKRFMNHS